MFAHITSFFSVGNFANHDSLCFWDVLFTSVLTFFREKSISEQQSRRLREHRSGNAQPTGIPSQERHQLNRNGNARVVLRAGGGWGERDKMKKQSISPWEYSCDNPVCFCHVWMPKCMVDFSSSSGWTRRENILRDDCLWECFRERFTI